MPPKTAAFKPPRKAVEQAKKNIRTISYVESDGSPSKRAKLSNPSPASPVKSSSRPYTRTNGQIQPVLSSASPTNSDSYPPETSDMDTPSSQPNSSGVNRPSRYQGASAFMRPFLGRLGSFVRYLLHKEEPRGLHEQCRCCGTTVSDTLCHDCFQSAPMCQLCFTRTHNQTPFHWARVWSSEKSCFVQRDISELRFVISLGHNGGRCPLMTYDRSRSMRIVDVNGIHETRIQYCHCNSRVDQFEQLMNAGLFPATDTNPDTAITFNLLETFNIDSLVSKKAAYDFVTALRRRTDPDFPDRVPNIHPQFLRVVRVWRALQMFKQSGQGHGIDDVMQEFVPGWQGRSLIQSCLACPQVGFNMEEEVDEDEWKHVETLFLSADGHFGLQRKSKVEDPDDVALTEDMGLFPDDRVYAEYTSKAQDSTEKTTCANLKAANMQNKAKFIGLVISGVIAITCARHNFFLHGGMVNMIHGEKFNLTDLALAGVLRFLLLVRHIVLTYDIACQYEKNLVKRFKENFIGTPFEHLGLDEVVDRFLCLVPKMHLKGHIPDCQYEYSLNFTQNVGRTYGEGIEGTWAEAKQAGGMTREMNAGHRIDTLNALQNDWNITKLQNLFSSLFRQLTNARSQARRKLEFYKGQSKLNGQVRVEKWLKMSVKPVRKGKHVESVYRLKEDKIPGQAQIYRQMLDAEAEGTPNTNVKTPVSQFLNNGLKIQSTQRSIKANARKRDQTDADKTALAKQRASLRGSLKRWREEQEAICPSVLDLVLEQRFGHPEEERLFLPSDLSSAQRREHQLEHLSECEMKLRRGEANDAIRSLRTELRHLDALWDMKKKKANHNVGTERNLRGLKDVHNSEEKVRRLATKYRECRHAMLALGMSAADAKGYPVLEDADMYQKNVIQPHALGEGSTTESWLWVFGAVGSLSIEERNEFDMECNRVKWFRARADMERWQEEVEILCEEFRRAIRACDKMELVWRRLAETSEGKGQGYRGYRAYACHQAEVYRERGREGRAKFEAAGGTWPTAGTRLVDHLKAERPNWEIDWKGLKDISREEEDALRIVDVGDDVEDGLL